MNYFIIGLIVVITIAILFHLHMVLMARNCANITIYENSANDADADSASNANDANSAHASVCTSRCKLKCKSRCRARFNNDVAQNDLYNEFVGPIEIAKPDIIPWTFGGCTNPTYE